MISSDLSTVDGCMDYIVELQRQLIAARKELIARNYKELVAMGYKFPADALDPAISFSADSDDGAVHWDEKEN